MNQVQVTLRSEGGVLNDLVLKVLEQKWQEVGHRFTKEVHGTVVIYDFSNDVDWPVLVRISPGDLLDGIPIGIRDAEIMNEQFSVATIR